MSNHLGDTNKMVNEPITDECLKVIMDTYVYVHQGNCSQRWVNYARELERKLNAANERIMLLEEAGIVAIYEAVHGREDDALEIWHKAMEGKENHNQQNQEKLKDRIKRLEEAGDELMMWLVEDICESNRRLLEDAWRKAKEAKL